MDGGGRFLRSLSDRFASRPLAYAVPHAAVPSPRVAPPRRRRVRPFLARLAAVASHGATGLVFSALVVGAAGAYGAVYGGAYAAFVAAYGAPGDLVARNVGLGIDTITIAGLTELQEREILDAAGVSSRNSLLFLDPDAVRDRLRAIPLVRDVAVRKLYPSRVSVTVTERQPYALWQKDGQVSVVAADGTVIDRMRDERFAALPFVVGEGANAHLDDYAAILDAAGDLRGRIKAGLRVANRRWDLVTKEGVVLRLPEERAAEAIALAARLARDSRLLDKDIAALDLRVPGRLVARLTDEAGAARLEAQSHKNGKGKV